MIMKNETIRIYDQLRQTSVMVTETELLMALYEIQKVRELKEKEQMNESLEDIRGGEVMIVTNARYEPVTVTGPDLETTYNGVSMAWYATNNAGGPSVIFTRNEHTPAFKDVPITKVEGELFIANILGEGDIKEEPQKDKPVANQDQPDEDIPF
jgi:hypothetical protein